MKKNSLNNILVIILIFVVSIFCISGAFSSNKKTDPKSIEKAQEKELFEQNDASYKEIINNPQNFFATGKAELKQFKNKQEDAEESATVIANTKFRQIMKNKIISSVIKILSLEKENISEKIDSKIDINNYLKNIRAEFKQFNDYPKKGVITVIAYITEDQYKEIVEKDLITKKDEIINLALDGVKGKKQKNIKFALEKYIESKNKLNEYFPKISVNDDNIPNDLHTFLSSEIGGIINQLQFRMEEKNIFFDHRGIVTEKPRIYLTLQTKDPVPNIPLKLSFIKGKGDANIISMTGPDGSSLILINYINIDPMDKEVILNVTIDGEKLGIDKSYILPSKQITILKKRSMAYCVNYIFGEKRMKLDSVINSLRPMIIESGFDVVEYSIKSAEIKESVLNEIENLNVNYFVYVLVTVNGGKYGDYAMYYANVESKVECYSFPEKKLVFEIDGPSAKGNGTSIVSAGLVATEKIKSELIKKIRDELKLLK